MRRHVSKMLTLEARHPGITHKLHAMFDEDWPVSAIKRIIETHYGERVSQGTIEKYKREHWRRVQEEVLQASAALIELASAEARVEGRRPKGAGLRPAGERVRRAAQCPAIHPSLHACGPAFIWRFGPVMKSTVRVMWREDC